MEHTHNTLNDDRSATLRAENMNYSSKLMPDVEYLGNIYQADYNSYLNVIFALLQPQLPDGFYWIDKDNNKILFDKQKLEGLANVIFMQRFFAFDQHQSRKERIRNATTVQQLFI